MAWPTGRGEEAAELEAQQETQEPGGSGVDGEGRKEGEAEELARFLDLREDMET